MTTIERAFVMLSESVLVNLTEPEQRKQLAEELRDYYLKKAELEEGKSANGQGCLLFFP